MKTIDFTKFNLDTIGVEAKMPVDRSVLKEGDVKNLDLLERCMRYWMSLEEFRQRSFRNHNYYRGNQWSEKMQDPDTGETITEEAYIRSTGRIPLKQNIIRTVVKNILGQFRTNRSKTMVVSRAREGASESEMLTNSLNAVNDINHAKELDVRELEKFLLSGAAAYKVRYGHDKARNTEDVKYKTCSIFRMFFNTDLSDIRLNDLRLIGEFYDEAPDAVIAAFAKTPAQAKKIEEWYGVIDQDAISELYGLDSSRTESLSFLFPHETDKYRVYEVWELKSEWRYYIHDYSDGRYYIDTDITEEQLKRENQERVEMAAEVGIPENKVPLKKWTKKYDQFWYGKYLTPMGNVLWEGETSYDHGEHPYVLMLYPLTNGEVWGFVEDIIDQQRYINRLISLIDFIIGNSAKGVLLAPEGSVPDTEEPTEWAAKWSRMEGVMFYTPKPGVDAPQQIAAKSVNVGANELLAIQMRLMNEVSGVHGAIQGQQAKSGTPASLYAQEAQNATLNTMDVLEVFNWFRLKRDTKALKTLIQYYEKRNIVISGADYSHEKYEYDPDKAKNLEWETILTQSMDAPAYRSYIDNLLYELLNMQAIDIEMFLENTSAPFADKILASMRAKREQMQETGQIDGMDDIRQLSEQGAAQAQAQANPRAMEMINQATRR